MIHNKRVPEIDGLRVDEAHKGGGVFGKVLKTIGMSKTSPASKVIEAVAPDKKEEAAKAATKRKRRGRSMLAAGSELGEKDTLG